MTTYVGLDTESPNLEPRVRKGRARKTPVAAAVSQLPLVMTGARGPSVIDLARESQAAAEADQFQADHTTLIEQAQAAFPYQGFGGYLTRRLNDFEGPADPTFTLKEEDRTGYTEDEVAQLAEARSADHLARIKFDIAEERSANEVLARRGAWFAIGASVLAGAPEGVLTGALIAKGLAVAGLGSLAAAQAGNRARAVGLAVLENVGGNVALTGVEDALGNRISPLDYAVAGLTGLVGAGAMIPGINAEALIGAQRQAAELAVRRQMQFAEKALRNLGDDANAESIAREISRLEAAELRADITATTASVPTSRRLLPDMEKLEAEELATVPAQAQEAPRPVFEARGRASPEMWADMDAAGVQPVAVKGAKGMLEEVATRQGPGDPLLRHFAGRLMTALGEQDIPVFALRSEDIPKVTTGTRSLYDPSRNLIVLNEAATMPGNDGVLLHEVAHAATVYKLAAGKKGVTPELARISKEVTELRAKVQEALDAKPDMVDAETARYFLKDDQEFVAGAFRGQTGFTDLLKSVKLNEKATAFNQFVDIVRRLLGLKSEDMDALTKVMNLTEELIAQPLETRVKAGGVERPPVFQAPPQQQALAWLQDPIAVKYGIDLLPMDTPARRAEAKAILDLYKRASDPQAPWNNIPPERIDSITSNSVFDVASTSLTMLKSENPVVRMVAAELIESPSGAAGRRSTAAIAKFMHERAYMGNIINEVQDAYKVWRNANGGGLVDDLIGGEKWRRFNRLVAEEIEARQTGAAFESAPAVVQAADALELAYERMRVAQTEARTIGWAGLPETSRGYMPHRLSGEAVRNMTLGQRRAFHSALVDQFVGIEGWDMSFANDLAAKYVDRVNARAIGGYDVPANIHQVGAADIIEDALKAMGMAPDEVRAQMQRYMRGGAGHTKGRIRLDLRREYDAGDGSTFTLMDLFETDQLNLVRQQAQRVSGEVALARHGIMGKPGLALLRRAMEMGDTGTRAQPKEVEAFDQVAAEMLGDPFGNYGGKWLNRAMQATSLARLGGMGFTQFAEFINAATGVGVGRALKGITGFAKYRSEILDLVAGKSVDNPILSSIETFGGAQFGTDAYKMVFPFDNPGMQYQVNGSDTVAAADRLLRGGLHAQGKLSGWRAIHSVQQRAVAEQIVAKAAEYINTGGADTALRDMGVTPELEKVLKANLPAIAKFDSAGKLVSFDITKLEDTEAAFEFVQAVHRGAQQMIQGTFVGETGKWAHDGWLRLLTQFRSFSITSVEKQWARQKSNHGVVTALAILMGSMAAAAPIYMARMYAQSIGKEDQKEWLEQRLQPAAIARATLNYVAMSGLAGDLLDALSSVSGAGKTTGGRQGGTTEFVGSVIAPSAGLADDVWRALQNSKDGTDPHDLVKALPFSKLPMLAPAINALGD